MNTGNKGGEETDHYFEIRGARKILGFNSS
jgi:hypothetical protein